jgi:nucleoside-diphosphate-sugar epimerase
MKKILLTGSTSFLGKRLLKVLPNDRYTVFQASQSIMNLVDEEHVKQIVKEFSPEVVVHLAAHVDLSRDFEIGKSCMRVNTLGTMNLLEAVKEMKPTFVYISSEEVYGNGPLPFKEDQQLDPPSPYAISKLAAEHFCQFYGKEYNFPIRIIRLGTFYGPEQPLNKYFAQVIFQALKNEPIMCNSGTKKRDYLYVDDAVDLIYKAINAEGSFVVNGAGEKTYSLLNVLEIIKTLTKSTSEVKIGAIPDRITEREEWISDISLAKKILQWNPTTDLEEGLTNMVNYYSK